MSDNNNDGGASATIEQAHDLLEQSFDAKYDSGDVEASNVLLEQAAQVYESLGQGDDADACRALIVEQ